MASAYAPGRLEAVQRFINTADLDSAADAVGTPDQLRAWLGEHVADPGPVDRESHADALELREALRSLAGANNGAPLDERDFALLDRAAMAAALRPRFRMAQVELEPQAGGMPGVLGRLVASVYEAMADGRWQRLKACARHSCRWVFYDSSKNRSATWCSMRVCGNRSKAERFRHRHGASRDS